MKVLLLGPSQKTDRVRSFLANKGSEVICYNDRITVDFCESKSVDWVISHGYAPIIKLPEISRYPQKIINLHPAYLPYGRGIYPNFWSIFERSQTGVSIHFIDSGIDTGDIICRREINPSSEETLQSFYDKLQLETEQLFFENWDSIIQNELEPMQQKSINADISYRSRLDSEKFMDLLTHRWNTPLRLVEILGTDFAIGTLLWQKYGSDFNGCSKGNMEVNKLSDGSISA